jgi:hypothetical protein
MNKVLGLVWKDELEEKGSNTFRKAGELARNLERDGPNPWLVWKFE